MGRAEDLARDPERFAAWDREQAVRRVELRQRAYRLTAAVLVAFAILVPVALGITAYMNRQHEREVERWEECAAGILEPDVDYGAIRRGEPEALRRLEEHRDHLLPECGERP